jgi:DNA-binding response OmpR family regulator
MKILIIEDDRSLLENTKAQFEKAGFGVDSAGTSE